MIAALALIVSVLALAVAIWQYRRSQHLGYVSSHKDAIIALELTRASLDTASHQLIEVARLTSPHFAKGVELTIESQRELAARANSAINKLMKVNVERAPGDVSRLLVELLAADTAILAEQAKFLVWSAKAMVTEAKRLNTLD